MFQVKVLVVSFKFWGASAPPSTYLSTALQCDLIINITAEISQSRLAPISSNL